MFIVTNREVDESARGLKKFGHRPNRLGPNELRLAEAKRSGSGWSIKILPDELPPAMRRQIDPGNKIEGKAFASHYVGHMLLERVRRNKRDLLVFVHGYNNDVKAVLDRAEGFEKTYGVEVLIFTWPANGGGFKGTASYLSDKRDARASVGGLDRFLDKLYTYLNAHNDKALKTGQKKAFAAHPNDLEERNAFLANWMEERCPFTVNLVLHSMGNYVFKSLLTSSIYRGNRLIFDNVVMVAADTNNEDHERWIDRIQCRNRLIVTINENDFALRTSRMKSGDEQLARLGHYPYNLKGRQVVYVNFTRAQRVKRSHAYFEGDPLRNAKVKRFFQRVFTGGAPDTLLKYDEGSNLHTLR